MQRKKREDITYSTDTSDRNIFLFQIQRVISLESMQESADAIALSILRYAIAEYWLILPR